MKWPVFVTVFSDSVPSSCTLLSSLESPLDRFSVAGLSIASHIRPVETRSKKEKQLYVFHR